MFIKQVFLKYFWVILIASANTVLGQSFSLDELFATPFVSNLTSIPHSKSLLFTVNKQGARNVFMIQDPQQPAIQLTPFNEDEGLEITSLQVSANGKWAVFVRGGDHGANSTARPTNVASYAVAPKLAIYSIELATRKLQLLAEGDFPVLHPHSNAVVYVNNGQLWKMAIDKKTAAAPLFHTRGIVRRYRWNPDGSALVFTAQRGDHSFIGLFRDVEKRIQWIAPSFARDDYPRWSPDGSQLVFIRQPAAGGVKDSVLTKKVQPWSIMKADIKTGACNEIWKSPSTVRANFPPVDGGANLAWPQMNSIVFLSYQDGWPQLYKLDATTNKVQQLTKGNFSVDDITMSNDGRYIAFCANTGLAAEDVDRRHIGLISLQNGNMKMITFGSTIESSPRFVNDDKSIAFLSSTAQQPALPAMVDIKNEREQLVVLGKELLGKFNYEQLIIPQQVVFNAADGVEVHGQLFLPQGKQGKRPAIVYVHGGPRRQMYLGWHHMDYYSYDYQLNQYLASRGFIVLAVNYRMGTGYGYDFQQPAHAGVNGASEYADVLAAGNWLALQSNVDSSAIGIYGGSYGGYLTAMALGKNSGLFKAGVDAHGVHNRKKSSEEGEAAPDAALADSIAWQSSPSRWVDTWTSPVLIIHGDDDQNVAFSQSIDLVNRLKTRGVQVEYLVVPDDTHHWLLYDHLLAVKKRTAAFLERNLIKTPKAK